MTRFQRKMQAERNSQKKLLPCPFCGANNPYNVNTILPQEYGYLVLCPNRCGAAMRVHSTFMKQVISQWNDRPKNS